MKDFLAGLIKALNNICYEIFLILLVLKWIHLIDWSWARICIPALIPIGFILFFATIAGLCSIILNLLEDR